MKLVLATLKRNRKSVIKSIVFFMGVSFITSLLFLILPVAIVLFIYGVFVVPIANLPLYINSYRQVNTDYPSHVPLHFKPDVGLKLNKKIVLNCLLLAIIALIVSCFIVGFIISANLPAEILELVESDPNLFYQKMMDHPNSQKIYQISSPVILLVTAIAFYIRKIKFGFYRFLAMEYPIGSRVANFSAHLTKKNKFFLKNLIYIFIAALIAIFSFTIYFLFFINLGEILGLMLAIAIFIGLIAPVYVIAIYHRAVLYLQTKINENQNFTALNIELKSNISNFNEERMLEIAANQCIDYYKYLRDLSLNITDLLGHRNIN